MGCRGFVVQSAWKVLTAVAVFGYKWKTVALALVYSKRKDEDWRNEADGQ